MARDYTKRKNTLRLRFFCLVHVYDVFPLYHLVFRLNNGAEYLFAATSHEEMSVWVSKISGGPALRSKISNALKLV